MTVRRPFTRLQRAMLVSVAAALATMALKFGAWALTGSVGLFSDAVESLVNLAAAILGFVLLGIAAAPADAEHTFGHEKAEYFASGAEGMLILVAAVSIGAAALHRLWMPAPVVQLDIGLVLSLAATGVNAATAWWLMKVAHAEGSIAVEADAHHLLTDVWTSLGVLVALGLLLLWPQALWLDAAIALAVAANILRTGLVLVRRSVDGLMDMQLPDDELQLIASVLAATLPPVARIDGLRTRRAGGRRFIEFNLRLPGAWSVDAAHALCDTLEQALTARLPGSETRIHVEPAATA